MCKSDAAVFRQIKQGITEGMRGMMNTYWPEGDQIKTCIHKIINGVESSDCMHLVNWNF